jgi:hypothetical protein
MRNFFTRLFLIKFALALFFLSSGCATKLIPNTNLRDNWENRTITEFMEKYRQAIESRSPDAVMELVSSDYFEDGGNVDPSDDYDASKLREKLEATFSRSKEIKVTLYLQSVVQKDDRYEVFYQFRENALMEFPSGAKWMSASDVNRIVARLKGYSLSDGLEIVSGL